MYSCQIKRKGFCVLGILIILGCSNVLFSFDLGEEIYSSFKTLYDKGVSVEYLNSAYKSEYPEDPFMEVFNNLDGMQKQVKVAGAQYIEDELKANGCDYLTQKEIWGILYYFVPEFRAEIAGGLKREGGHKNSKKMALDESTIKKYCEKYYVCVRRKENQEADKPSGTRRSIISATTSKDVMTKCKNYFQSAYAKGSADEKRIQDVNNSRAGNDKYWNASTDDSPYDIMSDLNNIGVFMYEDTTEPITPVFYNLPVFSNSAQSLLNNMNSGIGGGYGGNNGGSSAGTTTGGRGGNSGGSSAGTNVGGKSGRNGGGSASLGDKNSVGNSENLGNTSSNKGETLLGNENRGSQGYDKSLDKLDEDKKTENAGTVIDLDGGSSSEFISEVYDELVDGLGTTSVVDKGTLFYGSLCKDEEVEVEPEGSTEVTYEGRINNVVSDGETDLTILSEEEYQEMVNYMMGAVDQYSALPEYVQAQIFEFVASLDSVNPEGGYNAPATPDTSDEAVNQIKSCVGSCKGLRMDQYLTCVEMCACGERTSKIFDPEGNSGLGPIAKIKFCTVPGMDMSFNEGGRKIVSIEAGASEILGAVDKLSREGKLGIWTKQTNFLDSSTKKMKIGKIISFSISVEGIDFGEKSKKSSKQYEERTLKVENELFQRLYNISNSLNDASRKNKFRMVGYAGENIKDYKGKIDANSFRENDTKDDRPGSMAENSQADRHVSTTEDLDVFLADQASYWIAMKDYINGLKQYADSLYEKKE